MTARFQWEFRFLLSATSHCGWTATAEDRLTGLHVSKPSMVGLCRCLEPGTISIEIIDSNGGVASDTEFVCPTHFNRWARQTDLGVDAAAVRDLGVLAIDYGRLHDVLH